MSKNVTVHSHIGPGLFGCLGIAFVVLKLTGYIDWSWWLVTLPFWGGLALVLAVLLIFGAGTGILVGIVHLLGKRDARRLARDRAARQQIRN